MPAAANRIPANSICDAVSAEFMEKSEYPILINGKALPHNAQQSIGARHKPTGFLKALLRFNLCPILFCSGTKAAVSYTVGLIVNCNSELGEYALRKTVAAGNFRLVPLVVSVTADFYHNVSFI